MGRKWLWGGKHIQSKFKGRGIDSIRSTGRASVPRLDAVVELCRWWQMNVRMKKGRMSNVNSSDFVAMGSKTIVLRVGVIE